MEQEGDGGSPRHQLPGPAFQDQRKRSGQGPVTVTTSDVREEGSKLLTPDAFELALDSELKRAARSQSFLTLVAVETSREWQGMVFMADDGTVNEVAGIIGTEVRNTDVRGRAGDGILAIVLLDADFEQSSHVVDRFVSRIEHYQFPTVLGITIGVACFPADAVDCHSLWRQAKSHRIVNWRGGIPISPNQN
jgi:GGDEF domain-containing protein